MVAVSDPARRAPITSIIRDLGMIARPVSTGTGALAALRREVPAVVVLDQSLDSPSAYEVCRAVRERHGERLPVVFVAAEGSERRDEVAALLLGADDFFAGPLDEELFVVRLRRLLDRAPAEQPRRDLTPREEEVLALLVDGHRTVEIAQELCITRKTTATHIERILAKLGAHSQAQAVAYALRTAPR